MLGCLTLEKISYAKHASLSGVSLRLAGGFAGMLTNGILKIVGSVHKEIRIIGLYQPIDGITNLRYKLLCFLTPNKKISKRKALAFNRDRCCHLVPCFRLIHFHLNRSVIRYSLKYPFRCIIKVK